MHTTLQKETPLILVADDDRFTRMLLRQILEQDGYRVQEVGNGEQCLDAYTQLKPDMVLLDAMMPVMDGFTCCTQLQAFNGESNSCESTSESGASIPVLMITGLNDPDSVERAFAAGAIDYITKPIHPPVLRQRLRRLLEASWAEVALRESEKKYRSVVRNLKEVIFQMNRARQLIFLNPAWTEITGFSVEESLGKRFMDFIHPDDHHFHDRQFQSLLDRQNHKCRYQVRCLLKNGRVAYLEVYASLFSADDGTFIGLSGTLNDITEHKRKEQHLSVEHAMTKILAESLTLAEASPKLLQAICENLGWAFGEIWSVDNKANLLHCIETWYLPSAPVSEFKAVTLQTTFSHGVGLPGGVWASGESIWMSDIVVEAKFLRSPIAEKVGLHAAFGLPILDGDEILGVIAFYSHEVQQVDSELLKVMGAIGSQIGQFIKRKQAEEELQQQHQILRSELNQAAEYVRSLLPRRLTQDVSIEQNFVPSLQLGGDAFDYRWLDQEHLVLYLLDVAGHGVKSALLSVSVLNVLRSASFAQQHNLSPSLPNTDFYQPSTVLTALNQVFQMGDTGDDYFTMWYGVYHKSKRQLVYACAGHPPAVLISEASTTPCVKSLGVPSLPIGMLPDAEFEDHSCNIPLDSTLFIFSDGVYEIHQPDGNIWGRSNFVDLLTAYQQKNTGNLDEVFDQIQKLNANKALDDDFSLLQVKFH